ncbi:type I methionyl aminopeptidase [Balneolales bacterium ANBcel1]|nr:type I methionyl aminopeptidase [Balneolales bacterium ANBcel1]
MVYLKNENEIEKMRVSAQLVSRTLAKVAGFVRDGVSTAKLNEVAEEYISKKGGTPAFKGYGPRSNPFPGALCISVNDEVVHGIPGERVLKAGDIVSIDCGIHKDGFVGDSAYTFVVEEYDEETMKLLKRTIESLYLGIDQARHGNKTGDIGAAIQSHCESAGYGVIRELVGHGIGRRLHEDPAIPNYGKAGKGKRLRSGTTIAIEPMITQGGHQIKTLEDGWTIKTADGKNSAHYEHDVVVRDGEPDILSTFSYIEEITRIQIDSLVTHG